MTSTRPNNVRPLLLEDIPKLGLSDEILENIGLVDYEDDNQLNRSDYIIGDMVFAGLFYTIVHGFPGDNAHGIIFRQYNSDEHHEIGEGIDHITPIQQWYQTITNDATDYPHEWWYVNKPGLIYEFDDGTVTITAEVMRAIETLNMSIENLQLCIKSHTLSSDLCDQIMERYDTTDHLSDDVQKAFAVLFRFSRTLPMEKNFW